MEPLKKILLCLRNVFTKKDDSVIPTDFSDLAPLDSIDNTSEYLNALDWALKNRRIRNVALCGPYGAGKSSIINSYLKSHADAQQKSLRISMATFMFAFWRPMVVVYCSSETNSFSSMWAMALRISSALSNSTV